MNILADFPQEIRTDGKVFSIYDFLRFICGYSESGVRKVYKRLLDKYPEVVTYCHNCQFPGERQRKTPVTDRKGLIKLLGIVPGEVGKRFRHEQAKIIHEFLYEPEKLAKKAIDRIDDEQKAQEVEAHVKAHKKYLNHYHGVHGQLKEHGCVDVHHATYNKRANQKLGLQNGQRSSMDRRQKLLLTAYQIGGEIALMDASNAKEWDAVNVACGAGNKMLSGVKYLNS